MVNERVLREAMAWCSRPDIPQRVDALRSDLLRQPADFSDSEKPTRRRMLAGLVAARSLRVKTPAIAPGRLLCFEPDNSLSCGGAEVACPAIFEGSNVPAWDTWVAYLEQGLEFPVLLAWVPERYVAEVELALHYNPEGCIYWAREHKTLSL